MYVCVRERCGSFQILIFGNVAAVAAALKLAKVFLMALRPNFDQKRWWHQSFYFEIAISFS